VLCAQRWWWWCGGVLATGVGAGVGGGGILKVLVALAASRWGRAGFFRKVCFPRASLASRHTFAERV
jgi:hypothetical protein